MKKLLLFFINIVLLYSISFSQTNAKLFRYPDVSDKQITFVYGGDIWVVAKTGGVANKLSSPAGEEYLPKFSPDGKKIAFSGNYDGNTDIYVIPVEGGIPERITYYGGTDRMLDWYPDGEKILFASSRYSERSRYNKLFSIDVKGGLAKPLPMPYGEFGSVSGNGNEVVYTKRTRLFRTWKRYRGGTAPDIIWFNVKDGSSKKLTDNDANNELPMFHGDKVYFLSDNNTQKRYNLWMLDTKSGDSKQLTNFADYDVQFPSIGNEEIVFSAGGDLYLLNLETEKYKKVNVEVISDFNLLKPKFTKLNNYIQNVDISPDGNRVVFEARGEIFSVPAKDGVTKNLTNSSGSAERYPAWSPNGKYIAYWSDSDGEYELYLNDLTNGKVSKLTNTGEKYKYSLYWSPDSKKLVFVDIAMKIFMLDVKSRDLKKVDQGLWMFHGMLQGFSVNWSHDSRYFTYSRGLENRNRAIFIYDTQDSKLHQVTDEFYENSNPVFDPEGKYLYFTTNRTYQPVYSDYDGTFIYPNATSLALFTLRKDVKTPLFAKNDEVEVKADEQKEDKSEEKDSDDKEKADDGLVIDFEGMESRMVNLPPYAGNMGNLSAISGKVLFLRSPNSGTHNGERELKYFDLTEREEKTIISGINGYSLSADGKKLLVQKRRSFAVIDPKPSQEMSDKVSTDGLTAYVDLKQEWKQIFNDVWRLQRDMFYDENMHGVDWDEMRDRYGKLVDDAVSRYDVDYLIGELIGELSASHTYKGGGDMESTKRVRTGYLGINWGVKNSKYFIDKIIRPGEYESEVRSPFDEPGVKVKEGDYILAVNGIEMNTEVSPYSYFQGLSGKTVELTINSKPQMDGAEKVIIKTLTGERRLRHLAWIEGNRKRVEEATNGEAGYIYVRSTGWDGQNELQRQFRAQFHKKGLIVDERFNSGGQIPDRFIEMLNRKPLAFWAVRDGRTWKHPRYGHFGPKVMMINGWSGSGGDAFPDYFRKAKLGKLVGTRTWGGLIGITGAPTLIDGGYFTSPTFRMYDPDGDWFKEGHGVDPDVEVDDDPASLAKGVDAQLEAAIKEVKKELKKDSNMIPARPAKEVR